ncbi:NAD-dependent epimerase/dehydratase family protein [Dethiobacter alkaliphilus]|uniref:NAD-dependent epimerase/dehydratase n=1 Tax=Dethiobacter alkaliphilus AHT 1 TaxID=555088 RepID=C0GGS3_DETAL|nr:NAD-dependent epimerase/dehydratase family protein [Dethiobacter alkaliphilus]EEG77514.1 NAD-dependent epimerase/dehydratase [Dethiobacter alkaliphilus AHT 1]
MNVLVTGGAGFIGSHTVDLCIENGLNVVVVDDLSKGRLEHINQQAKFYKLDVRQTELTAVMEKEKIDAVIHLAAQSDVQTSLVNPGFDASVNILGTLNVLEASIKTGVKKVVYASSAAVYGEPQFLPIDEKHPLNGQSGYGLSKQVPEKYLSLNKTIHGLDFTALRYANVYGPRQDAAGEGGVVAIFTDRLPRGEETIIYGDGEQTRDFVYVGDVAQANFLALQKGSGRIMNVSTGQGTSVNELYGLITELLGTTKAPVYAQARAGDIRDSFLANNSLGEELGWKPKTGLREGLRRMLLPSQQLNQK